MADIAALLQSVATLRQSVQNALARGDTAVLAETNRLMEELQQELDRQTIDLGLTGGGNMGVAVTERVENLEAGTQIDASLANHFTKQIVSNTTFTVTNVPVAGRCCTFTLRLTNAGAYTVNFWAGVRWSEGVRPTLTAAGRDVIAFSTIDGGITWDAYLLGKDMKPVA